MKVKSVFLILFCLLRNLLNFWVFKFCIRFLQIPWKNERKDQGKGTVCFPGFWREGGGMLMKKRDNSPEDNYKFSCSWCLYVRVTIYIKSVFTVNVKSSLLDFRGSGSSIFQPSKVLNIARNFIRKNSYLLNSFPELQ